MGMRRILYLVPLAICLAIGGFFYVGLDGDPSRLPSAFIDKPAPDFALGPLPGRQPTERAVPGGLSRGDLTTGEPVVVNVWASWCIPCVAEHPLVDRLASKEGVTVHGINYRDKPADASAWLARLGDPYARIGADEDGRAGIEWGVYGVPETFVIDGEGVVRFKHAGALTPEILERDILPLIRGSK